MNVSHKELLQHCIALLDSFDSGESSVDSHVNHYFEEEVTYLDVDDQCFITEVFAGCIRFAKVLDTVVQGFYNIDGKTILRSEWHLFTVITYLALFRLDELQIHHFHKFIMVNDTMKMYKFLSFFLNERNILTWMKDEWGKHYDSLFIQKELLSPLQNVLPELQEILDKLEDKVGGKFKTKKAAATATVPQPFNLTKPRPRSVPMPEAIPVLLKTREAPRSMYKTPREKVDLEEKRLVNRRQAEDVLMEAAKLQPQCAQTGKSEKVQRRMDAIERGRVAELDFSRHKSNPVPDFQRDNIPVKLNAAAIMREWKHYNDKEKQKLKKLDDLESGAFDASRFLKWQTEMRASDLAAELAEVERRRLGGKLSYEEAILARRKLEEANREAAAEMKAAGAALMAETEEEREMEEEQARRLVEAVLACRTNAKKAKKDLQQKKSKIVKEVHLESQELTKMALEEAKMELARKMEVIAEIRAMEATPAIRDRLVDLSAVEGHGLLSEMSIAELRERLSVLKAMEEKERDEKRDSILEEKQKRDAKLMLTLEQIGRHRVEKNRQAAEKLEKRKGDRSGCLEIASAVVQKDQHLTDLEQRLEERRRERLAEQQRQKAALGANSKAAQMVRKLSKEKTKREQNRWAELEASQERAARQHSKGAASSSSARRLAASLSNRVTA